MTRFVLLAFICLGASVSRAEGTLPGGGTMSFGRLFTHENNSVEPVEPSNDADALWNYFNLAHCQCSFNALSTPIEGFNETTFQWELLVQNSMMPSERSIEIWTGPDCKNDQTRPDQCFKVTSTVPISQIEANNGTRVEIPIYRLMFPNPDLPGCDPTLESAQAFTWALADDGSGVPFEFNEPKDLQVDTKAPELPINFRAIGAEGAIRVSWDPPPAGVADVFAFQAMCAVADGGAPVASNRVEPRYMTARRLCGVNDSLMMGVTEIEAPTEVDAGDGTLDTPDGWTDADPMFLCGETLSSTATEIRIDGLENGVPYIIGILVMDKFGNARGTFFSQALVPTPATDLWEDLHDQGSGVQGGLCLLAQAYGDNNPMTDALRSFRDNTLAETMFGRWLIDVYYGTVGSLDLHGSLALRIVAGVLLLPLVAIALLWHVLTLPGLLALIALGVLVRRRRLAAMTRGRLAAAATVGLVLFVPMSAQAQAPYWEENEFSAPAEELPPGDPQLVNWHAGIRLGPYVPGIDAQLGMPVGSFDGPYEQMFGGSSIVPMLDVDRFLWKGFGQLGVGVSIGYMGKKARAWQAGSDPMDPDRPRSEGDENKFRMIPMSLNAVYRFTVLDDNYGVPIVPYARGGLAYYLWWITAPNGDFAKSCVGPNTAADCTQTTAFGGSLGLVGSIGLAIRAERIDENATRSMRDSGIQHAGFYAEYSFGKVDGFGSEKKLSVGDSTWFAGVDFEF